VPAQGGQAAPGRRRNLGYHARIACSAINRGFEVQVEFKLATRTQAGPTASADWLRDQPGELPKGGASESESGPWHRSLSILIFHLIFHQ
jgi:hypothetical protein